MGPFQARVTPRSHTPHAGDALDFFLSNTPHRPLRDLLVPPVRCVGVWSLLASRLPPAWVGAPVPLLLPTPPSPHRGRHTCSPAPPQAGLHFQPAPRHPYSSFSTASRFVTNHGGHSLMFIDGWIQPPGGRSGPHGRALVYFVRGRLTSTGTAPGTHRRRDSSLGGLALRP